jgi:hypothetical protein
MWRAILGKSLEAAKITKISRSLHRNILPIDGIWHQQSARFLN